MGLMDVKYAKIAMQYGKSGGDFEKTSTDLVEDVLIDWSNEAIDTMRVALRQKSKSKSQTLAESIRPKLEKKSQSVKLAIQSDEYYYDFVDKGVKGVKKNKAPNSPYSFKTIGVSKKMVNSFKKWIAYAGITKVDGVRTAFKGKTRKKALSDQERAARTLAVRTKIGGIKPKGFIKSAINKTTVNDLKENISSALGQLIRVSIINYGNNSK